jgi:hypothetical protein
LAQPGAETALAKPNLLVEGAAADNMPDRVTATGIGFQHLLVEREKLPIQWISSEN